MTYVAAAIVVLAGLLAVVLTLLTLPGIWLLIAVAVACQLWQPGLFSLWTLAAAVVLGLIAELIELAASALGARRFGSSKVGMTASVVGGVVGALVGTGLIPIPVIGTIAGAVIGAGIGAFAGERGVARRGWRESGKAAGGAAAGRLAATLVKTSIAAVIAILLGVAAFAGGL